MNKYIDNLFSADSRRAMIEAYGFSESQIITLEEIIRLMQ